MSYNKIIETTSRTNQVMEDKYLEMIKESRTPGPAEADQDENEEDLEFPGFRFHPTDQELVGFYLTRKVEKKAFSIEIIKEIDIYKHDPWDLPKWSHLKEGSGQKEWYFFCLRGRKYRNSIRPNRVTGSGFWKATGIDKSIYPSPSSSTSAGADECIGLKKSLVYYRGSAGKGIKTDWMMHEFRLPSSPAEATINASSPNIFQDAEIWTICRIFKRNMSYHKRCQQQQQDQHGKGASSMIRNKRSDYQQQQQQQLESYYHHHHYTWSASMATNSFESDARVDAGRSHVTTHQQPFLLHGFHGASSAAVPTPGMGAPPPSGRSELMSFWDGSSSWDELGRITEISTDSTYL